VSSCLIDRDLCPHEHPGQKRPEEILARIAFDPANLGTVPYQDEGRGETNRLREGHVLRLCAMQIEAAQRRRLSLGGFRVNMGDLSVPSRAPGTAGFLGHQQMGLGQRRRGNEDQKPKGSGPQDAHVKLRLTPGVTQS